MSSTEAAAPGAYEISTDPARLDVAAIHAYLTRSYWSPGIPIGIVERALRNSLCFGVYESAVRAGRTRASVTMRHLSHRGGDVHVPASHRGSGRA
jgi:hypothetical protein